MRNVVGIVSGKGGVGKTTVSVNLGLAMHKLGEEVVVMDGDLKNPNFGLHLGIFDYDKTVHEVLNQNLSLLEALHIHETGLRFIPAHLSLRYLNIDSSGLKQALKEFDTKVLIDSPPGLDKTAINVLEACDEILVVTSPYLPDVTDALKTVEVAKDMGVKIKGIVLNRVMREKHEIGDAEVEATLGAPVIGKIPFDKNVLRSLAAKKPVVEYHPYAPASVAFFRLASKLTGKEYKEPMFLFIRRWFR
ncbi:MAG: cell division ATPase MinD [Candidatus Aenigmarchaeota archaeon]|nr:cell division ATPase MinD [Candidatus Aenigmarchaeota archaeon]